ncbi:hypothetical protein FDE04_06970 [Vibrio parahaemolyticus]|nr:hypothetical protein [Vibrio parahaemolyticus]EGR0994112.1 hypothetical protein [Vibrio parahaemolyticus]EGR3438680.1 hypothetical protein [Vibrio parahaemolyticus]MQC39710.1 hypothetical protein [Vibrio parahaemolyticus]MQC64115.1 hypothetical protein [Vibrio parahaemolyticus]
MNPSELLNQNRSLALRFFIFDKLLIILHLHNLFKNCSFVLLTPLCWASMFDKVFQICRLIG